MANLSIEMIMAIKDKENHTPEENAMLFNLKKSIDELYSNCADCAIEDIIKYLIDTDTALTEKEIAEKTGLSPCSVRKRLQFYRRIKSRPRKITKVYAEIINGVVDFNSQIEVTRTVKEYYVYNGRCY